MLDDVKLAAGGQVPVTFYGRTGGMVPVPEEIYHEIAALYERLTVG
jgi:2-oxoglutarate ferredoxin oxidoreductase subunit alpha